MNDGTRGYITREHGILVNATGSFDPDGTELKYIWKYGAEPTKPDNTTAKFRAYERAASIVEDEYDLRTKRNFDFLNYFVPDVSEKTVVGDGPHYPNETVRFRVKTEPYHFSKQTYYRDFGLGASVSNPAASVVEWRAVEAPKSRHSEPTEDAYRYVGTIEIPADELAGTSRPPTVTIYNEDNARKRVRVELPETDVLLEDETYWRNVSVRDLAYLVEKRRVKKAEVDTKQRRDEYLRQGYRVEEVNNDTRYVLEKRVKVRDAKYETVTETFPNERQRDMFLDSARAWYAAGTHQTEETRTRTYSNWFDASTTTSPRKWHDSSLWNGEHTGATREVQVEPAEYETKRKYRYSYEVRKTGTRTVKRCSLRFGCETETVTYTYTDTEYSTYWATSRYAYDHWFTGKTKRVKVRDAVYETQFEVRYKSQSTELVTYYEAARDEKVQEARYEWDGRSSTMDYAIARKQAAVGDEWRIAEEPVKRWTLVRTEVESRFWTPAYENRSRVSETTATVTGELVKQYSDPDTGETVERSEFESSEVTYRGARDRNEIRQNITSNSDNTRWCEVKAACSRETKDLRTRSHE
ncbi:hypothetical protein [Halorussus caseinilyticus]|uniref:Uncharacterized protein n=1 Tax=Halorussus caseinilyticus TaxID=3034025 RepID=A0ABD5WNB6_9EURY